MTLIYVLIASILAAAVNFCLRKNLEQQKSSKGYLTLYFICSFLISFLLREISFESFNFTMTSIGAFAGMLNFLMMVLLALCVQKGSSGLTFAFQNSASILPTILLFVFFGSSFGFNLSIPVLFGFSLIVVGLFLSSRTQKNISDTQSYQFNKWIALVLSVFLLQGIILFIFQWRCLLLVNHVQNHMFIPFKCSVEDDSWFMPGFFVLPAILQTAIFIISEKRGFFLREAILGIIGGALNGGATFFLLLATKEANQNEKMILFPLFAVSVIFLCNLWGRKFYKEKINWLGMSLCLLGVFIGSLKF